MGVTLERVQNKFACIIGELCSEPVVLSQFAIWLDLRLAEYKAKGAISLECSGDDPDPTWLRGHNSRQGRAKHARERQGFSGRSGSFSHRNSYGTSSGVSSSPSNPALLTSISSESDRLHDSDDVVVVKNEPADSDGLNVFPVTLHEHENFGTSRSSRKRAAAESLTSDPSFTQSDHNAFHQQSPSYLSSQSAKIRRVTGSSTDIIAEPISNQSLMEIISGKFEGENNESADILEDIAVIENSDTREDNPSLTFLSQPGASTSHSAEDSFGEFRDGQDGNSNHSNSAPPSRMSVPIQRYTIYPSTRQESLNHSMYTSRVCKAVTVQPGPVLFVRSLQKHIHKTSVAVIRGELDALESRRFGTFVRRGGVLGVRKDCFFKPWPGALNQDNSVLLEAAVTLEQYTRKFYQTSHLNEEELTIVRRFHPQAEHLSL